MSEEPTWLTQEAFDRLAAELEHLLTFGRTDIANRIAEARAEGDLKENGGYHAAKEEQGKIEARIYRLERILESAVVGEPPASHGVVEQGMLITVELNGSETSFLLGSAEIAEDHITVYSPSSPIGNAILGKKVGEEASYKTPMGKTISVKILKVETFAG
ncbi:MAG: transcription elongation factor GreA [Micrococcales bacterium]